jgi:GNAT superfamily N-acetyltransferase
VYLRDARAADAVAVAIVHVRSWQIGYRGLLADDYLDGLRAEDRAAHYAFGDPDPQRPTTIVAVEGDAIRGFATTAPSADDGRTGELVALYVDPDHWGRGLGGALLLESRARLARQGFSEACLWLFAGNERAARFYRGDGWAPDGRRRRDDIWGITVDVVGYRRPLI